ncbi:MAG: putative xanthine dehydrogenase subunit D [Anaerolineales bacterium]|nr:putative xanthine dehydrogenase subunit D [Anaerolineales bacterium]
MAEISIGKSLPRIDARDKVTGQALYSGDLAAPGLLHMQILFAGRPHARIARIDAQAAESAPDVVAVFTSKDVPVNERGLQIQDQPVLCGPGPTPPQGVATDIVRFEGDQVAAIVARSEAAAAAALKLIQVEYEDLPGVFDPVDGMQPAAAQLHPERGDSNVCVHYKIRKGDVEDGFAGADVIIEGEYKTPYQEHAYLQPEAGMAYIDEEGRVTVVAGGQWPHTDVREIAHCLGLPQEQVRVIYPAIGGAFGGREDMSVQIVLALAAWKLKRPVRIIWSRRESIIGHGKRHPSTLKAKWGATKDGMLVAAEVEMIADGGAYMYTSNKVLGNSAITCTGPYFIPNVKADIYGVYTNNVPTAAFRGFGAPQALFMAESQMNKLAEKLGMDPVELRLKNALKEGDLLNVGTPVPLPVTSSKVMKEAAKKFGWDKPASNRSPSILRRGRGFAAGFKNIGFSFGYQENCWAKVEIHGNGKIEKVIVYHAGAEVGQGAHTVMAQMAAHALGVGADKIEMHTMDTAITGDSGSVSASRMTFMAGNSIKGAAEAALKKWQAEERPAIAEYKYFAPGTTPFEKETGRSMPNFAYAYVAQAVEVEVDTETGHVRVIRITSADDVGKAINPALVQGQIEGAIVQAQGHTILEDMKVRNGKILTDQFSTYLIPTIHDIPEKVESVIVEEPDPNGPWGARGVGEPPFLTVAPAIIAAVHDATGIWLDEFPITPERVLRALGKI